MDKSLSKEVAQKAEHSEQFRFFFFLRQDSRNLGRHFNLNKKKDFL